MAIDEAAGPWRPSRALPVQRAAPGAHLCGCHASDEEQHRVAAAFVASGLAAGDRVLYVTQDARSAGAARALTERGVPADDNLRAGQLAFRGFADVYGSSPRLEDVEAVSARYRSEAERSRADGHPGLRVAIEMGDFAATLGSVDAAVAWERTVTPAFADAGIVALCQYNRRLLAPGACARIAAEHPAVAMDDGTAPIATFTATAAPWGVRVAGDLDRSNTDAFARVLRARAAVRPRVTVDLEGLEFADLGAVRAVFEVAQEAAPGSVFVLRRVPRHVRRVLGVLGWSDDRVRVEPA